MPGVKTCSKCGRQLPATFEYFHRDGSASDGWCTQCKACKNAYCAQYREEHREMLAGKQREYHWRNRDERLKRKRAYHAANRETENARRRRLRQQNQKRRQAYQRQYYQQNREYYMEYRRQWAKHNPDRLRIYNNRRRARLLAAEGSHTAEDIQRIGNSQGWRCWYCQEDCRDNYHVEHRVPLSRGGSNDPSNIVISCPTCNLSKRDKLPHEWCDRLI